ncbi:hypothetical protein NE857_21675 [Nocardiopsis exhalans]|uniref:Uncharacterized protein n=1 Tax=Nocardiopsis exhalans TaxID=163604 RepID=A0ABY5D321_9ACTN|nr:hypothetical protein [Nocardiopsis exhalans]USY17928.1 hypothetical protein NE857_21675 [Nocardiopsis exhalans]
MFVLYRRLAHPAVRARLAADFDEIEKLIDEHGDQVDIDDPVKMKPERR